MPPSSATLAVPSSLALARTTYTIRPTAIAVVTRIDTHGVRRVGCTFPKARGSTSWLAMP